RDYEFCDALDRRRDRQPTPSQTGGGPTCARATAVVPEGKGQSESREGSRQSRAQTPESTESAQAFSPRRGGETGRTLRPNRPGRLEHSRDGENPPTRKGHS